MPLVSFFRYDDGSPADPMPSHTRRLLAWPVWRFFGGVGTAMVMFGSTVGCGTDFNTVFQQTVSSAGRVALDSFLTDVANTLADRAEQGDDMGDGNGTIVYDNSLWPIKGTDMTTDMGPGNPGDLCEAFGGEMSEPMHATWSGSYENPMNPEPCPPK